MTGAQVHWGVKAPEAARPKRLQMTTNDVTRNDHADREQLWPPQSASKPLTNGSWAVTVLLHACAARRVKAVHVKGEQFAIHGAFKIRAM